MIRIKNLLPSLKEKKRYILYEIDGKMNYKDVDDNLKRFIGELGYAKAGVRFVKSKEDKGIIQVNHRYVDEVKTGLALINKPIRTKKVSGVLNKVKEGM
ncbi:MAG: Rpp14/Pop5 family protein [Nanoarchaeota archaeon]